MMGQKDIALGAEESGLKAEEIGLGPNKRVSFDQELRTKDQEPKTKRFFILNSSFFGVSLATCSFRIYADVRWFYFQVPN